MKYARIHSTGSFLPKKIITNHDLEKMVDTSDEWIVQRTGIKKRHVVSAKESATTMAVQACKNALISSNLKPSDIEMVIGATCTQENVFPAISCLVQKQLDIPPCPTFDLHAACGGFIYALSIANEFICSGKYKRILIFGSEAMSRIINWKDRTTCVLFGDGAGAVILEASNETGVLSTHLMADGKYNELFQITKYPYIEMPNGKKVFQLAVKILGDLVTEVIKTNNITSSDVDWIVPHQANLRIITATANKLEIPMDKVIVTVDEHANTSAASIPLALDVAIKDQRIKRGQNLLLEAFGGGLIWGAALVKY